MVIGKCLPRKESGLETTERLEQQSQRNALETSKKKRKETIIIKYNRESWNSKNDF